MSEEGTATGFIQGTAHGDEAHTMPPVIAAALAELGGIHTVPYEELMPRQQVQLDLERAVRAHVLTLNLIIIRQRCQMQGHALDNMRCHGCGVSHAE